MSSAKRETERVYIEALKRFYRLPITIKTKISGNAICLRLVNQYLNELNLDKNDDYCVFYIYDCDVKIIVDKIRSLPGNAILTNPCFELWYILHSREHTRNSTSESLFKALTSCHSIWKSYSKGYLSPEQTKHLLSNVNEASARAKKLQWPDNPSSNMFDFIEALEQSKNT